MSRTTRLEVVGEVGGEQEKEQIIMPPINPTPKSVHKDYYPLAQEEEGGLEVNNSISFNSRSQQHWNWDNGKSHTMLRAR